jgi:hypothetical protein
MDITYLSLNKPRDSSLSTCKVCHFLQLEAEIVSHPALFLLRFRSAQSINSSSQLDFC